MEPLRPYQQDGANVLASKRKHYLGDEPGLGKTRIALTAVQQVGAERVAVITPAIVRSHWTREAHSMGVLLGVVESYDMVVRSSYIRSLMEKAEVLIVDEAHFCKHTATKRTKAIFGRDGIAARVLANGGRVWCLSGTPAPRNPAELYAVLKSLWPQTLANIGITSYVGWLNRFCRYRVGMYGVKVYGAANVPQLRELLDKVMTRRLVRDVAPELPKLRWGVTTIEAPTVADALLAEADLPAGVRFALMNGELPPMSDVLARYRHDIGNLKSRVAAEMIRDELNAEPEMSKKVVFAYHRSVLDHLEVTLSRDFSVARIDGSTPVIRRELQIRRFKENEHCRVFLGQIGACATGLDGLQHVAHDAIIIEPDWSAATNTQAAHRLARMGQTMPVQVRMLSLAGTLDTYIIRQFHRECGMAAQLDA